MKNAEDAKGVSSRCVCMCIGEVGRDLLSNHLLIIKGHDLLSKSITIQMIIAVISEIYTDFPSTS